MDNFVASELRTRVLDAFLRNAPPDTNEIVSHDCEECYQLKNDFDGLSWWEADSAFIGANFDKLPLFTPAAYQYYLPAYILGALTPRDDDDDDDTLIEFLVYSWSPSSADSEAFLAERRDLLSTEQMIIVQDVLQAVISDTALSYIHKDAEKALKFYLVG